MHEMRALRCPFSLSIEQWREAHVSNKELLEFLKNDFVIAGLRVLLVLAAGVILTRLLRRAVTRVESKVAEHTTPVRALQRTQTLTKVVSSSGIVVIWSLAGLYLLQELDFNVGPLLAGAGIVGLAVGFGAQSLVKDVVTGFFILLEDQYGVGDNVLINEVAAGKVETLTLRVTGLRDLDGTLHYIANGDITHVANRSKDWARAVIDVKVAYREDPERVRQVLDRVAGAAKEDPELGRKLYSVPQVLGVEALGDYEVIWRVIAETKPARQWEVARQLRERITVAFDDEGIEIPLAPNLAAAADSLS
jgi:moderate conductance mechanosensitive channel